MSKQTISELTTEAEVIRDETLKGVNSKTRVYNMFKNIIDSFKHRNTGGWVFQVDDARETEGNAVTIAAEDRVILLNDGASSISQEGQINDLGSNLWDKTNNRINPELSSAYHVRLSFNCKTTSGATGNYIELELDIGSGGIGSGPVIFEDMRPLVKGAGVIQPISFSIPIFAEEPFPTNGGTFFLHSNVDITLWRVRIYIVRTYKALS